VHSDPAALQDQVAAAGRRVLATATRISDGEVAGPSLLPGWSRGHVLTHIARNADGLRNLLIWARTGTETPQYASPQAREDAIRAGAARTSAELAADISASAEAFLGTASTLGAAAWQASVAGLRGPAHPAWVVLWRRLSELEIHHVDLDAGYRPADWPASFVTANLARVARDFAGRADAPACLARPDGLDAVYPIGPPGPEPPSQVTVSGPPAALLAWLIGRGDGAGLGVTGTGAVPVLPPWR